MAGWGGVPSNVFLGGGAGGGGASRGLEGLCVVRGGGRGRDGGGGGCT